MEEKEYRKKYVNLRILKSIQEYLKSDDNEATAVYPIRVPEDLLFQVLKMQGSENADKLIHHIFKIGLSAWSEKLYNDVFGSQESLEEFIRVMKERTKTAP
ncbi:MAG: hypothetical protein JW821_05325 [Deltaproteobacteria bacterium]|nr:hypothetical protein [Deltaproteobacteria bacterium]